MKTKLLFLGGLYALFLLASCWEKQPTITANKIKKLYTQNLKEQGYAQSYASIDTGYYELNYKPMRDDLKKLEAAGLVTYSVERYAWYNKVTDKKSVKQTRVNYNYWYGYYEDSYYTTQQTSEYQLEEHFMVRVSLTPKGKKLTVDSIPVPTPKIDKYMKYPEYKASEWPEDNTDLDESWPEIPHPANANKPQKTDVTEAVSTNRDFQPVADTPKDKKGYPIIECLDSETKAKYEKLKAQENSDKAIFEAFELKVSKVRNIHFKEVDGIRKAIAEVVIKTTNVTHAGHILMDDLINDIPAKQEVSLTHYVDKKWVLDDVNLEDLTPAERPTEDSEEVEIAME